MIAPNKRRLPRSDVRRRIVGCPLNPTAKCCSNANGCKREWRALVWAAEREIHERDGTGHSGRGGSWGGGNSRPPGGGRILQEEGAGSSGGGACTQTRTGE